MHRDDNARSRGDQPPDDLDDRIRRAELMGRRWGQQTTQRLRRHLPHWDPCPRVRLRLSLAALDASRATDGHR
jgi:hypothetical protein